MRKLILFLILVLNISPVYSSDTIYLSVPQEFSLKSNSYWNKIINQLQYYPYKTYYFYWKGEGGDIVIGHRVIKAIEFAQQKGKKVIFILNGNSYSMHAMVACYASKIINKNNKYLMFHRDAYNNNSILRTRKDSNILDNLSYCIKRNIITQHDEDMIWKGYEVYRNTTKTWYKLDLRF